MEILTKRSGDLFSEGLSGGYTYKKSVADGETSDPIIIPPLGRGSSPISACIIAGTGTGKIQTTISSDNEISEETATWMDWDKGEVTGTDCDVLLAPVTGIRGVSVSGIIIFELLI